MQHVLTRKGLLIKVSPDYRDLPQIDSPRDSPRPKRYPVHPMEILKAAGGIAQTNSFVIADEVAKQAVMFDAPNDTTAPLLDEIQKRGWDLVGLWFTHGHFDHIADHQVVTTRFPHCKILAHKDEEPKLTGHYPMLFPLPFKIPPRKADAYVTEGQVLQIGSIEVQVMHVPGHAAGHVVYYLPKEQVLVGGDMIIGGAIGRTDLPDSDFDQMRKSLQRIIDLPEETTLLPGHGDISTLQRELHSNCMLLHLFGRDR